MAKQYMFGCELISTWLIGSPVLWQGKTENGEEVVYVIGKVLEYIEGQKHTSTTFDPKSVMSDIPENYVEFTYELQQKDHGTLLTVIQRDFFKAQDGRKRYEESKSGWKEIVIPTMNKLLGE